jgi:chromate transporter
VSETSPATTLTLYLATLSVVAFGGIPAMLPDLRTYMVVTNGWLTDREFANFFAVVQSMPGPNMVVMMGFVGWKLGGAAGALGAGLATFGPSSALVLVVRGLWDRFRGARWQRIVSRGLAPVTLGLVTAGGFAMASAADTGWQTLVLTVGAAALVIFTRFSPLWALAVGAALGGMGLL